MNLDLSPQAFAIEAAFRRVQRGEIEPVMAIAELVQVYPALSEDCHLGLEHPLGRIVMELPEGRRIRQERGWK